MMRMIIMATIVGAATLVSSSGHAGSPVEMLIGDAGRRDADSNMLVDLRLLNADAAAQVVPLPDRIEARIEQDGSTRSVWLDRATASPQDISVPAGGFVRVVYRLSDPANLPGPGATISIPAWRTPGTTVTLRPPEHGPQLAMVAPPPPHPSEPPSSGSEAVAPPLSDRTPGNAFLSNLAPYEPIYAVYGPGTDSAARIQISFKYQLFGTRQAEGLPRSWRDGLHFAYTQRMFWDLESSSSPFRNVDFQPELFYLSPATVLADKITLSAQVGIRHESNGRDGDASRSVNTVYVAPMAAMPLGGGYRFSLAPSLAFLVGDTSDNPDIQRYRGNFSLFMELGQDQGLRLSTSSRLNFSSGKGAVSAELSYPLKRLLGAGPDFYLFGQTFAGYGENLFDYNRRTTRFRVGLALVR
ncbi:phospholipase A [Sandaracinobacteroides hominis]|uniref:phospholipase A n=1 Tax=Sandaracinobacteroides hominis TaxID=2780086 RepID=UPI001F3953A1|nr:phospholipase A [Sandaracinobacteroides hominis]